MALSRVCRSPSAPFALSLPGLRRFSTTAASPRVMLPWPPSSSHISPLTPIFTPPGCPHCWMRVRRKSRYASKQQVAGVRVEERTELVEDSALLKSLHLDGAEEQLFRRSLAATKPCHLPGETDLIDAEVEDFMLEGFPVEAPVEGAERGDWKTPVPKTPPQRGSGRHAGQKKRTQALKQEEREKAAKVKRSELEKAGRELSLNRSVLAYLEMCVSIGQLNKAFQSLNYYRTRDAGKKTHSAVPLQVPAFNVILHAFAAKGNYARVEEVFEWMLEKGLQPTAQSYAAAFECLGRMGPEDENLSAIESTIQALSHAGLSLDDLFNACVFKGTQREAILVAIRRLLPNFEPNIRAPFRGYVCPLLSHLNHSDSDVLTSSPLPASVSLAALQELGKEQLRLESRGTLRVKSIQQSEDGASREHFRTVLAATEAAWATSIEEAFERNMNALLRQSARLKNQKAINLQPFLKAIPKADLIAIITQEIRKLAEGSETYSPSILQLHRELGTRLLAHFDVRQKEADGVLEKVRRLYADFLRWYADPSPTPNHPAFRNAREKWQSLLYDPATAGGPHVDVAEKGWPNSVLCSIGRFLYAIIMRDIKVNPHVMKAASKQKEELVPAFYSIFRMHGVHLKEEIKPHPSLVRLFEAASRDELLFDSTALPMLSPPLPWASIRTGGYLLSTAKIIRLPYQAHQQRHRLETSPPQHLYPALDALNQLGAVPWKVNHEVLDALISIFNAKGDEALSVPQPPSECPSLPPIHKLMTKQEKFNIQKQRQAQKRRKAEMYSLWCDALYKLSLANHFREKVFWLPHNMDFRGRVYPCAPHLNHLGSDVGRAMLLFAKGRPLGTNGLDWLKIHVVNLTGVKKRDSLAERLKYANEMLPEILDSGRDALGGGRWWAESEEPWQTLACCMEIRKALESGDPEAFVSHFPVHQDGSCNGLQHYAALGRDQAGAESVNLSPAPLPQDVYSAVAALVEKVRLRDAENGVPVAKALDGFIKRKVIKQTVMTTVYGVTRYGARLQIAKQLKGKSKARN